MANTSAPVIGINLSVRELKDEGAGKLYFTLRTTYVDAIKAAGGVPVLLPAVEDDSILESHAELCDGFIFTGGDDLHPSLYGQEPVKAKSVLVEKRRQEYDMALVGRVLEKKKPFLAICLGCQEVNVSLGGDLIQDIHSSMETVVEHSKTYSRHDAVVEGGTLLASLVGEGLVLANTSHHQAIDRPGKGVKITSRCPTDGIIESFELEDYPFGLGIQWHPEMIFDEPAHLALFQGLVRASSREASPVGGAV